jgi:hypothetical protein
MSVIHLSAKALLNMPVPVRAADFHRSSPKPQVSASAATDGPLSQNNVLHLCLNICSTCFTNNQIISTNIS